MEDSKHLNFTAEELHLIMLGFEFFKKAFYTLNPQLNNTDTDKVLFFAFEQGAACFKALRAGIFKSELINKDKEKPLSVKEIFELGRAQGLTDEEIYYITNFFNHGDNR